MSGPGVDEVSEWYNEGSIIGVYTAPMVLYYNYDDMKYPRIGMFFVKYEIKIKDSINYECNINKLTYIS